MVFGFITRTLGFEGDGNSSAGTTNDGPTRLPDYFPVEPKGCEKPSQSLFNCLANEATDKQRDLERVGFHRPYFANDADADADDHVQDHVQQAEPTDPVAAKAVRDDPTNPNYPKPTDNPLDECSKFINQYRKCCDRALKRKQNWILTEAVRVQEEYRYSGPASSASASASASTASAAPSAAVPAK
eukprot:CAMPEP_0113462858 /NCGR_PEP_ID=MMETSP0014_2-20120614/12332_1 /TAXON_ID=2857 /ORGANISM="Nitzschia sp." /LENGTH=185 /DNA_ID=CAMNT_0000354781 /DNA_START=1024 /DNA_END=1581 /DNA_ORIENTATION=+ /assembly_acc=CAM_ASM_000159